MSLDFNGADQQGTGASAIPEDSIVLVKMTIRPPRAGKQGTTDPLFCRATSGNEFIDVEFEVPTGRFTGRKIWQNFVLSGSEAATKISMRTLRAILEAWRGIDPEDQSPTACQARTTNGWGDFNQAYFPAIVGVEISSDGRYVNNTIKRVLVPTAKDKETWSNVMGGKEVITDKPLPIAPNAGKPAGAAPAASGPAPAPWAGGAPGAAPAATAAAPAATPTPAWAKR